MSIVYSVRCTGRDEARKVARILTTEWYMEAVMTPVLELYENPIPR